MPMVQIGPVRMAVAQRLMCVPVRVPRRGQQFGVHVRVVSVVMAVRVFVF